MIDNLSNIDVIVIGGGPAGLAAATKLKQLGVKRVVVLEREKVAGGIPRHCGHPPFGMREFKRVLTGSQYAKKLVETAEEASVEILTSINVIEAREGGKLLITSNVGAQEISAKRIIYATGVRENSRAARLISGARTKGIINTGVLQQMVFLQKLKPFKRPVIIGSELVAFSAILTCRHAKIKPVAMIEVASKAIAQFPMQFSAPLLGVPLHLNSKLTNIIGDKQVSGIEIENSDGKKQIIECDGVILTGDFTPEASLARMGHLEIDVATGGVKIDQYGRCSDPVYFAAGNLLRPVETAGWSWNEGQIIAAIVAKDLQGALKKPNAKVEIFSRDPMIKLFMPQEISLPQSASAMQHIQLRFSANSSGEIVALNSKGIFWRKSIKTQKEKRFLIPITQLLKDFDKEKIELKFLEKR